MARGSGRESRFCAPVQAYHVELVARTRDALFGEKRAHLGKCQRGWGFFIYLKGCRVQERSHFIFSVLRALGPIGRSSRCQTSTQCNALFKEKIGFLGMPGDPHH